jgi:hypothetical protein
MDHETVDPTRTNFNTTTEKLTNYFKEAENHDTSVSFTNLCTLPLDGKNNDKQVHFSCACCGEHFKSTLEKQKVHDQDMGYGFCPDCEQYSPNRPAFNIPAHTTVT